MFSRKCPECNKDIIYKHEKTFNKGINNKTVCRSCYSSRKKVVTQKMKDQIAKLAITKKGKTYEEIYGIEKTNEYKLKLTLSNKGKIPHNKGKRYDEIYDEETNKKIKLALGSKVRGKTYEEVYGTEKANKLKDRLKINNNLSKYTKENIKGKTYEEIYGDKNAQNEKNKRSAWCKGKTYEEIYGIEKATEIKDKLAQTVLNSTVERNKLIGVNFSPNYSRESCMLFEKIEKLFNFNGFFATKTGEFKVGHYWLDYYEPNYNIWIEWDDIKHEKNLKKDERKERYVFKIHPNINLIRILTYKNEGEKELIQKINNILKNFNN